MNDIKTIINTHYQSDITSMESWCNEMYDRKFKQAFNGVHEMFARMQSTLKPIADSELEWILTMLPMELFSVSEELNKMRLETEVIKLKNKTMKSEFMKQEDPKLSATVRNENVASKMVECEIVLSAYNSVITRVENEISFSKELIMGAKKIWDSRRRGESSNPVKEVKPLPEYKMPEYYVK